MSYRATNHKAKPSLTNTNAIKSNNYNSRKSSVKEDTVKGNYYLVPIFIVLCMIPLFVRMKIYNTNLSQFAWFAETGDYQADFFLYYKHWLLIIIVGIMAITVAGKAYLNRKTIKITPIFIPLAVYALFVLLSAIFSKYASFSFGGSFKLFETVFVLLGYCIIAYYSFLYINSERDSKLILYYIMGLALVMSLLGVFQFLGYDFFASELGFNLIMPSEYRNAGGVNFNMGEGRVYMTLYNPNYVGVYVALITPIILVMLFFQKKIIIILLSILSIIGLIVCAVGAQSLGGVLGLGAAVVCIPLFMWRYLIKRLYITIPVAIILTISLIVINNYTDQYLVNKLKSALQVTKTEYALTDIHTEEDHISLTYNDNTMKVQFLATGDQPLSFLVTDNNNEMIEVTYDVSSNLFKMSDTRFSDISFGLSTANAGAFNIYAENRKYEFTNLTGDEKYYYINRFGRADQMVTAPSYVFTGYEKIASGRGYIWSRTLPLLKDYIFLGSGPDTFTMAFPQQDYMNLLRFGYSESIMTKPHNMYLQIAVQTGVLSLIAFLLFYAMYFISSIRIYFRGLFSSIYARLGVAIFIGTISYMVTGIANDSNINTAPIFWTLIGVGIAVNIKAKSLIHEEVVTMKAKKEELKKVKMESKIS